MLFATFLCHFELFNDRANFRKIRGIQDGSFIGRPLLPVLFGNPQLLSDGDLQCTCGPITRLFHKYGKIYPFSIFEADTKASSLLSFLLKRTWCPQPTPCLDLPACKTDFHHTFLTGIPDLNRLLGGGLQSGELIELVGKPIAGKSQLCFLFCAAILEANSESTVLFLDTSGNFSASRILYYIKGESGLARMRRLRCCLVPTVTDLLDALVQIRMGIAYSTGRLPTAEPNCQKETDRGFLNFCGNLKLIVVDSMTLPFLSLMSVLPSLARSELSLVAVELQRLTRVLCQTVVVTNHSRATPLYADLSSNKWDESHPFRTVIGCLGANWACIPQKRLICTPSANEQCTTPDSFCVNIILSKDVEGPCFHEYGKINMKSCKVLL
ncbi:hypothetical protein EG68_08083 [Paragonimus skrjabini miyazakii]|uniref:RecA family profile 1 domain-containing protein n=1 Tax=Paragonimus skrjabini miyazakii TaxID=59628 RepID=A0A8S9YAB3_9TREM|nr:hypothetical protein EG68_08083 [Paragonimus skrjabini miyazakii]